MAETLLDSATTNGDGTIFEAVHREYVLVRVYGVFDGATVQAYADFDNSGTYCILVDGSWTSADVKQLYLKPNIKFKLTVSGAGASTDLNAELI